MNFVMHSDQDQMTLLLAQCQSDPHIQYFAILAQYAEVYGIISFSTILH